MGLEPPVEEVPVPLPQAISVVEGEPHGSFPWGKPTGKIGSVREGGQDWMVKNRGFKLQRVPALSPSNCVTFGELLNLSLSPACSHLPPPPKM